MRIHYLSGSELPSPRANSVNVMKMCNAFARIGHDVTLFAYRRDRGRRGNGSAPSDVYAYYDVEPRFEIRPIRRVRVPGAKRLVRAVEAARGTRSAPRPDLLYGRDLYSLLAARGSGVPMIFEAHTPPQNRAHRYLIAQLLREPRLARVVVISQALADRYAALYPWFPSTRWCVAHDGADVADAGSDPASLHAWPGRVGMPQVGYAGSLLPGKGADVAVALADRLPDVDFHVLGGTPDEVRRLGGDRPRPNLFLHGHVAHQQVPAHLDRLDVALLPAQRKVVVTSGADIGEWMSPLKLFEYMAASKAIVASDLPVIREVLCDGVNGLLVPPDDLDAWCAAVERLARDPALRERLGLRARQDFAHAYTWTQRGQRVLAGLDGRDD